MTTASFVKESDGSFHYLPSEEVLWPVATDELKESFWTNGFIIIRNLFSSGEVEKLVKAIEGCKEFWTANYPLLDLNDRQFFQSNWNEPGTDILGMAVRNAKFVGIAEQLLNRGELYLYNGKVIMKQPETGGALLWHQDYGYWYNNRAIFPDFITGVIALTKSDRENGGLEVIRGSHHCGRIEHHSH
uniref:Phytanoyl-CoA dioxygenase family protein n=1 Tax=Plectus sambesii TaxID=2011161 RepID=A0A914V0F2_9BILA